MCIIYVCVLCKISLKSQKSSLSYHSEAIFIYMYRLYTHTYIYIIHTHIYTYIYKSSLRGQSTYVEKCLSFATPFDHIHSDSSGNSV